MAKIVIMGLEKTGKTTLINRLCGLPFSEHYAHTRGTAFYSDKIISAQTDEIQIEYWEIAYDHDLLTCFLQGADLVLCVFSLHDPTTLKNLRSLLLEDEQLNPPVSPAKIPYLLIGTQADLTHRVTPAEVDAISSTYHMKFFSCSAKTGSGCDLLSLGIKERLVELHKKRNFKRAQFPNTTFQTKETKVEQRLAAASAECLGLWQSHNTDLNNIRAILKDYARDNSGFKLWLAGHPNRHHTGLVNRIVQNIDEDKYMNAKEVLLSLDRLPIKNHCGSLSLRISYIKYMLKEDDPYLEEFAADTLAPSSSSWCGLF